MPSVRLAGAGDLAPLLSAFENAGWPRSPEQLERYLREQAEGLRLLLVAHESGAPAGYLTLEWEADYPPFRRDGIPEVQDLSVVPTRRRRGVATRLLDEAESRAAERASRIGLSVGLYAAYGPAQRLYALRGYHPDGAGATSHHRRLHGGETIPVDDSLSLHLVKQLAEAPPPGPRNPPK